MIGNFYYRLADIRTGEVLKDETKFLTHEQMKRHIDAYLPLMWNKEFNSEPYEFMISYYPYEPQQHLQLELF